MQLFKLYLGGYNCDGWYSGLIVNEASLHKLPTCKIFADKHLVGCIKFGVILVNVVELYGYHNYLIHWSDGSNSWKMEVTLLKMESFL